MSEGQFTAEEHAELSSELRHKGKAIRIIDALPCAVQFSGEDLTPCMNKATVIIVEIAPGGSYRFNPPSCKECTTKLAKLYKVDINPEDR